MSVLRRTVKKVLRKGGNKMKHKLLISVSKKPRNEGIVSFRKVTLREKLLRFLLGTKQNVTILVPGSSVEAVSISEISEGGTDECVHKI